MKILYVTPYYKPAWFYGGPPKCISEQAEYLVKRYGFEIHVVTLNKNGPSRLFEKETPVVAVVDGVQVHYLPVQKGVLGETYFYSPVLKKYLAQFSDVDVVHVHMLFNAVSKEGMSWAIHQNIPLVVSLHGMLDAYSLSRSFWLKKIHRWLFEDRLLQKARAIHFTTENEFKNAVIALPIKPVVIPIGFSFEGQLDHQPHFIPSEGRFRLVFLGRINRKKGLDVLISALATIPSEKRNHIVLDIWGEEDEPCKDALEQLIVAVGLQENVFFKGKLAPEKRNEILDGYDVLVLTSHQENFGLVLVEAWDRKIPVLISDKVNLKDFVLQKEAGWVSSMEAENVAQKLEEAFDTPAELRAQKGLNGYHAARKLFHMKVVGQLYNELYEVITKKITR